MELGLKSDLLNQHGFAHGFSMRRGGISVSPFDSLNLGRKIGDDEDHVCENYRLFARWVGYETLYEVSQLHGAHVEVVASDSTDDPGEFRQREADAVVLLRTGAAAGIRVADCVPILVADRVSGAVAAIHAGWKGIVAGVIPAAIDTLQGRSGSNIKTIVAAMGPHIGKRAFEVGEDVAAFLAKMAPGKPVVNRDDEKWYVDLAQIVAFQLEAAGLEQGQIDRVSGCTFSEPDRFFSYRRDGRESGRHLAVIVAQ
jgi:YfiH family protein